MKKSAMRKGCGQRGGGRALTRAEKPPPTGSRFGFEVPPTAGDELLPPVGTGEGTAGTGGCTGGGGRWRLGDVDGGT